MLQVGVHLRPLDFESVVPILPGIERGAGLVPLLFGAVKLAAQLFESGGDFRDPLVQSIVFGEQFLPGDFQDSMAARDWVCCSSACWICCAARSLRSCSSFACCWSAVDLAHDRGPAFFEHGQARLDLAQFAPSCFRYPQQAIRCDRTASAIS